MQRVRPPESLSSGVNLESRPDIRVVGQRATKPGWNHECRKAGKECCTQCLEFLVSWLPNSNPFSCFPPFLIRTSSAAFLGFEIPGFLTDAQGVFHKPPSW